MATRETGGAGGSLQQQAATTGKEPVDPGTERSGSPRGAPEWRDQATDLGRKATEGARQLANSAQSTARDRLERGKSDAAVTLSSVASTLLSSGAKLRDGDEPMAGEYVERAARRIEQVANYVRDAEVREMVAEVEDFAKRRPAVFIGSAFALGLLAARFLKSSREAESRGSDHREAARLTDREVPSSVAMEPGPERSGLETWPETT
jgi:hypothetical protein